MIHGHEILHMMEGKSVAARVALVGGRIIRIGAAERFCTCSVEGLDAAEIVDFLDDRGKFMETPDGGFTVNLGMMCNH